MSTTIQKVTRIYNKLVDCFPNLGWSIGREDCTHTFNRQPFANVHIHVVATINKYRLILTSSHTQWVFENPIVEREYTNLDKLTQELTTIIAYLKLIDGVIDTEDLRDILYFMELS